MRCFRYVLNLGTKRPFAESARIWSLYRSLGSCFPMFPEGSAIREHRNVRSLFQMSSEIFWLEYPSSRIFRVARINTHFVEYLYFPLIFGNPSSHYDIIIRSGIQYIDYVSGLDIDQYGPIALPLAEEKLVDASNTAPNRSIISATFLEARKSLICNHHNILPEIFLGGDRANTF